MILHLFGRPKFLLGDWIVIRKPLPKTVGELRRQLMEDYPSMAGLLEKSGIAVNHEFTVDETPIPEGAELALLPPVSGG